MAKFRGARQENAIGLSVIVQPNGQLVETTFANLLVQVGGDKSTLVATQVASFILPMSENATDFQVQMTMRGTVQAEPGTRVILLAHLGDTNALVSLPENGDYQQVLQATFPAGVDVQTTLFLLAERNTADESALLTVDEADFKLG